MKKIKLICALSAVALLSSCCLHNGKCIVIDSDDSLEKRFDPYDYSSVVEKRVPVYQPLLLRSGGFYYNSAGTVRLFSVDDSSIPYVDVATFCNEFLPYSRMDSDWADNSVSYSDGIATITNMANNSTLTLNFYAKYAYYSNYETFFTNKKNAYSDHFVGAIFGSSVYDDYKVTYDYHSAGTSEMIDFDAYNFKCYLYNDYYLIPFNLACSLIGSQYITKNYLCDNGAFYLYNGGDASQTVIDLNKSLREKSGTSWIDQKYMEYTYDSLALYIDMFFGLDERQSRVSEGKVITYNPNGAYAMLEPYKSRLLSTDLDVANDALTDFFKTEMDDGGHNMYVNSGLLGTKTYNRLDVSGSETANTLNTINGVAGARTAAGTDALSNLPEGTTSAVGYYKEYDNGQVAYIQFDSFTLPEITVSNDTVDENNYYRDSVSLFCYANQKIQSNPSIKDVIIDLSGNGGGVMYSSEYIASWVCGGNNGVLRDAKTRSVINYRVEADVDGDGYFDSGDYLDDDISLYVMTSNGTFSSGNKLSCNIFDNRKENTYFIGSQSGGGSCAIANSATNYLGAAPRYSSNIQLGHVGSTMEDYKSVEDGVMPTTGFAISNSNYAEFADIDSIVSKVVANRSAN